MKPANLHTKIFLDSGNPEETKQVLETLGFLDGQTTNPTLISKHPVAQQRIQAGKLFSADEALGLYKEVIQQISTLIPRGAISVEVYADETTKKEEMLIQADEFINWMDHPYIKFPITSEGLAAAEQAVADGMKVNMTLCFSQEQAAAVYSATEGAKPGQVFLSPFIGRIDDTRQKGLDMVRNIEEMFSNSDHHVHILAASIRSLDHLVESINVGADCVTAPLSVLLEWAQHGFPIVSNQQDKPELQSIEFQNIPLDKNWRDYQIQHELTSMGLEKFVSDWNALIKLPDNNEKV